MMPRAQESRAGASRLSRAALEWVPLALLFATLTAVNLWWVRKNTAPMADTDPYGYMTHLLRFVDHLASEGLRDLPAELGKLSLGGRPPLYQLLTVPFLRLFGRSEDAALAVNIAFLALLLVAVFAIGKLVGDGTTGLLAAVLLAGYPPIVHLSRIYRPYFAVPACLALSLWLLLLLLRTRSIRAAWGFGLSLAFGTLIHPNFVYVAAVPTLVFGLHLLLFQTAPRYPAGLRELPVWLGRKLSDRFAVLGLGVAAALVLAATLPWYLSRGSRLLDLLVRMASEEFQAYRGVAVFTVAFPEVDASFWWYAETAPGALSNVLAIVALIGLISAFVHRRLADGVLVVTLLGGYVLLSLSPSLSWSYGASLLPVAAILSACWLRSLRPKALGAAAIPTVIGVVIVSFALTTWGTPLGGPRVAQALGAHLTLPPRLCQKAKILCPSPPVEKAWPLVELLEHVFRDPRCRRPMPCELMVVDRGGLGRQTVRYTLARERIPHSLTVYSPGVHLWGAPYPFRRLLSSDYLVFQVPRREHEFHPDFWSATERFLAAPPRSFAESHRKVTTLALPTGGHAELLRRSGPLTLAEAADTIAAMPIEEKYKVERFELLARLRRQAGDLEGAEAELHAASLPILNRRVARRRLAKQWLALGLAYREAQRLEESMHALERAVELAPEVVDAQLQLARSLAARGRIDEAIDRIESARRKVPDSPRLRKELNRLRSTRRSTAERSVVE